MYFLKLRPELTLKQLYFCFSLIFKISIGRSVQKENDVLI